MIALSSDERATETAEAFFTSLIADFSVAESFFSASVPVRIRRSTVLPEAALVTSVSAARSNFAEVSDRVSVVPGTLASTIFSRAETGRFTPVTPLLPSVTSRVMLFLEDRSSVLILDTVAVSSFTLTVRSVLTSGVVLPPVILLVSTSVLESNEESSPPLNLTFKMSGLFQLFSGLIMVGNSSQSSKV